MSAFAAVRRGSRNSGKQPPWRSSGIFSSTLPARVPHALSLAVAAVDALGTLLVVAGAAAPVDLEFHLGLGHELHRLAQYIDVGCLLGEFGQCLGGLVVVEISLDSLMGRTSTISGTTMATPTGTAAAARQTPPGFAPRALSRRKTCSTPWDSNRFAAKDRSLSMRRIESARGAAATRRALPSFGAGGGGAMSGCRASPPRWRISCQRV